MPEGLRIEGADEVVFLVSAGTDMFDKHFTATARRRIEAALGKSFDGLLQAAVADHFAAGPAGGMVGRQGHWPARAVRSLWTSNGRTAGSPHIASHPKMPREVKVQVNGELKTVKAESP